VIQPLKMKILLRIVSRQISLQAVKNESQAKMPKFLHTKCRQANKQAHPPFELPLQYYKKTERKKKEKNDRKDRKRKTK